MLRNCGYGPGAAPLPVPTLRLNSPMVDITMAKPILEINTHHGPWGSTAKYGHEMQ